MGEAESSLSEDLLALVSFIMPSSVCNVVMHGLVCLFVVFHLECKLHEVRNYCHFIFCISQHLCLA